MGAPIKYNAISGFDLEVMDFVDRVQMEFGDHIGNAGGGSVEPDAAIGCVRFDVVHQILPLIVETSSPVGDLFFLSGLGHGLSEVSLEVACGFDRVQVVVVLVLSVPVGTL